MIKKMLGVAVDTYGVTIGEHSGCAIKGLSSARWIHFRRLNGSRTVTTTESPSQSASHFDGCWSMHSRIEVSNIGRKSSVCICLNGSGRVEVFGDVYLAARISLVGALDVLTLQATLNAECRGHARMSMNGGRECQEKNGSNEGLGQHIECR